MAAALSESRYWEWNSETLLETVYSIEYTNRTSKYTLRKVCPYSKFLWSVFSRIRTEYGDIWSISPYSVQIGENTDQNDFEYGNFSPSDRYSNC